MLHLTCGASFLLLFVFLINLVHHHHPALLRRQALILDRLLTFLTAFFTLVLKFSFSQSFPSIAIYPFHELISCNMTTRRLTVTGGGSVGECRRLT